MILIHALTLMLEASLFLLVSTKPIDSSENIVKRDLASDICGTPNGAPATDQRTPAEWTKYEMDNWFDAIAAASAQSGWPYSLAGKPRGSAPDIQSLMLAHAGNEGAEKCGSINVPKCSGTGYSYDLCKQQPEAHFVLWAIDNWANYLSAVQAEFNGATISLTALTSTLVKQFYTPQTDPTKLLVPVGIVSGIASGLSGFFGPAALIAGAGSIVSSILLQASLDKVDPLVQWGQVQSAIGSIYTQISDALAIFYNNTLNSLPPFDPLSSYQYTKDPAQLPMIFKNGAFASQPKVISLTASGLYSVLAAAAINALWAQDKVFVLKISDAAYGKGAGAACKAFPIMTVCQNGVAHIFARWVFTGTIGLDNANPGSNHLDVKSWNVWGAYAQGSSTGENNANNLETYSLDLTSILASVQKTSDLNGGKFPFTNQNGATIKTLVDDTANLTSSNLVYFSLPICDIDAILGPNKHLNDPDDQSKDDPIIRWGACTCLQGPNWPGSEDLYPDNVNGYGNEGCQANGWGSN